MIYLFLLLQQAQQPGLSDVNWNTIVLALINIVGTVIVSVVGGVALIFAAKISRNTDAAKTAASDANSAAKDAKTAATDAAVKVAEVKTELVGANQKTCEQLTDIQNQNTEIHTLVNSKMGLQLKLLAIALRRIADSTGNEADIEAAELAEQELKEHNENQAKVDKQNSAK